MKITWQSPWLFAQALWRSTKAFFSNKDVFVTPQEADRRTNCCYTCDYYDDGQCNKCTCYVHVKALLREENCPIGRWPKV
jgi:hypothetical protein